MAEKTEQAVGKNLVIVESPAKAKTISRYLGKDYTVKASIGHIVDLPKKTLGVNVEKDFEPEYEVMEAKKKVAGEIKSAAKKAGMIYLAPDPDREGEAIAWHIANLVKKDNPNIKRVLINEITKQAVQQAIADAGQLDQNRFEAQQARRILDRLVGYQISPLLWNKIRTGLSAGRVQSVAVRLICDREREILAFKSEEYWTLEADFKAQNPPEFPAKLSLIKNEKAKIQNQAQADQLEKELKPLAYQVSRVEKKEKQRRPPEPFITARLQQEAVKRFGFPAKKTMSIAQQLYEGVDLGPEGRLGLITYMRTDSVRVSDQAIEAARKKILELFGPDHLPATPNIYKSKKTAQEAHEAIRPTMIDFSPDQIHQYLTPEQQKLYRMIYERFLASQMKPAILDLTVIEISGNGYTFRATGSVIKFPGFLALWQDQENGEDSEEKENSRKLPVVSVGEKVTLLKIEKKQHFTQPPPRYNEASLIRELEEKGIGRPSTYAQIVTTIQDRKYVQKEKVVFKPTALGFLVNDILVLSFPDLLNIQFTARMEDQLDEVEEGKLKWVELLKDFYKKFSRDLEAAPELIDKARGELPTGLKCPKCGKDLAIRWGKNGEYLKCAGYPECDFTSNFKRDESGKVDLVAREETGINCPLCGKPLVIRKSKRGEFLGCSGYPKCKSTSNFERAETGGIKLKEKAPASQPTGLVCEKCAKPLVIKSRGQREFLACSGYPACRNIKNFKRNNKGEIEIVASAEPSGPEKACPKCGKPLLYRRGKYGPFLGCSGYPECKYLESLKKKKSAEDKK